MGKVGTEMTEPEKVRLHKYIAACGLASRRAAEKMIEAGRVKVNGMTVAAAGTTIDPHLDKVEVDNSPLRAKTGNKYFLLYKPRDTITTVTDPYGRKTVMELIPCRDVFPVGRLDRDTEGLLLLTDDGELAYRLTHPRFEVKKKYQAWVKGTPGQAKIRQLEEGVVLDEGAASPAATRVLARKGGRTLLELSIHEGKKHQVKRMCSAIGHPVLTLKRVGFAFLTLKGLKPGEYRELEETEVKKLLQLTN